MNTAIKVLFSLLLSTALSTQAQFTLMTNGSTITITGYNGISNIVNIPATTNGLPITTIGQYAFDNKSTLVSVILTNNVTNIGLFAFYSCSGLTNVTLGNSVTNIGSEAFAYCARLTNFAIPAGVTNLGAQAFLGCSNLTAITVSPSNSFYSSSNGVLFNKNQTTLLQCPAGFNGGFAVPNTVISLGANSFQFCNRLTSLAISNALTSIGESALASCTNLTAITVATNNSAFASVAGVLFNHSRTTLIQYPGGLAGNYTIPGTVTSLGDSAFGGCPGLTGITIPASVTTLGQDVFANCTGLTSITIPNGIATIPNYTFYGCSGLTNAVFGSNVTSIGEGAFYTANNLTAYFLGNAPSVNFPFTGNPVFYYLPGTTGWDTPLLGQPTLPWLPQILTTDGSFGLQTNQFGFNISWAAGQTITVQACTNLANPGWTNLQTLNLTNGFYYFSEPRQTNFSGRFYRISSP